MRGIDLWFGCKDFVVVGAHGMKRLCFSGSVLHEWIARPRLQLGEASLRISLMMVCSSALSFTGII